MRNALTTMVGMAFLSMAACGGGNHTTTGGTNGAGSGSTGGLLANGLPCTSDDLCQSDVCGINGTGNCCATACVPVGTDPCAAPTGCDNTGACAYPVKGQNCGTTCTGNAFRENTCDGAGACTAGSAVTCDGGFGCGATLCNSYCTGDGGCAVDFFCSGFDSSGHGSCTQQVPTGPCVEDQQCQSGECGGLGVNGATSGYCCGLPCQLGKYPECLATACTPASDAGQCVYPPSGTLCDKQNQSCTGYTLNAGLCDGMGTCDLGSTPCPDHLACNVEASMGCLALGTCQGDVNCAPGYYCQTNGALPGLGDCLAKGGDGGCAADDQCISGVCGAAGKGNCCAEQCNTDGGAICGASGCDGTTALCEYPDGGTTCGSTLESCANDTQQNPSICDGMGNCPKPGTLMCAPYACSTPGDAGCFKTCTDSTSCFTGDFCDTAASACCQSLAATPFLIVDSVNGKDGACCGFGGFAPCATITYAMNLINDAEVPNVVIQASVMNAVGTWAPAGETYPIKLGWGVSLQAQGVAFWDTDMKANAEVFDIAPISSKDTTGYASIYGANGAVLIGMDLMNKNQTQDSSAIQVESGETLYLANATVNGNAQMLTTAITVLPGGNLILGQDQSTMHTGTVQIGNSTNQPKYLGWSGIVCGTAGADAGCTITDVAQNAGASALVIEDQEQVDIDAEDLSSITLTVNPAIGVTPGKAKFNACAAKIDAKNGPAAVLLHGSASVTFSNGKVGCIGADAFELTASASTVNPTLTLDTDTIENSENAIVVNAGTATVTSSTIEFNYNGVSQSGAGKIDLSGGGNAVICSSEIESVVPGQSVSGINVLNLSATTLNASNVAWDTTGPDLFSCTAALNCTCEDTPCTDAAGGDGMDAVYESTGSITTTTNTQSMTAVNAGCK